MNAKCERCGQQTWGEIAICPLRTKGECPFEFEVDQIMPALGLVAIGFAAICAIILTVAFIAGAIALQMPGLLSGLLCVIPAMLVSLTIGLAGATLTFGSRERIFNPGTQELWQKITLKGKELFQSYSSPPLPIILESPLDTPLLFPASTITIYHRPPDQSPRSSIYWENYGSKLIKTAIAALMFDGCLAVRHSTHWRAFFGHRLGSSSSTKYYFVLNTDWDGRIPQGFLEGNVMQAVKNWSEQPGSRYSPQGIPPQHLVQQTFTQKVRWNPGRWLYKQVLKDAQTRGLDPGKTLSDEKFNKVEAEHERLLQMVNKLSENHPEFIKALESELRVGLSNMEWTYIEQP